MRKILLTALSAHWNLSVRDAKTLKTSASRQCFRVETDAGPVFAKIQISGNEPDNRILTGLKIQEFVRDYGVPAPAGLPCASGRRYHIENGHCITVEEWLEPEKRPSNTKTWEDLGLLCARLHSVPVHPGLAGILSRMDPENTLDEARQQVAASRPEVPVHYRKRLDDFISRAAGLDTMPELSRVVIHSDITWKNIIRTGGQLVFVDFEGAGIGPAVMDLVEVTTKLCGGPGGSGPLMEDAARAFYRGYTSRRPLDRPEINAFAAAHFFHQFYYLADSLRRRDFDFIARMDARLRNWKEGVLQTLLDLASS